MARLQHPNIVQIFEVGEHAAALPGRWSTSKAATSLASFAGTPQARAGSPPLVETLARAVHHGPPAGDHPSRPEAGQHPDDGRRHAQDRRLRPGEDPRGRIHTNARAGWLLGTPSYMAPEQATGKTSRVGPATDIYALGAILYELLSGRPPFVAGTPLETLLQVVSADIVPPRRLVPSIPRDLEIICLTCLEKDPDRRYASAAALHEDLARFVGGRPIKGRVPAAASMFPFAGAGGNPALAIASSLAVAGLLGVAIVSGLDALRARRDAGKLNQSAAILVETLRVSEQHRRESELRLADSYLERARSLFRQGDDTEALLCLARTLQLAPPGDAGLDRSIRSHIGSFVGRLHQPSLVLDPESQVGAVALSDDGATVACGKFDGVIVIWDTRTGNRAGELTGHRARIRAPAISPDGRTLASGSDDGTAQFWSLATRRPNSDSIKFGSNVLAVAFSPDGRRAFTGDSDGRGRLWEVSTGEPIGEAFSHPGGVRRALFDPNGTVVLTYGGDACAHFGTRLPGVHFRLR